MSTRSLQNVLASVFFILGGWCLFSPGSVIELSIQPDYRSDAAIVPFLMAAFGAQAMIAGLFALTTQFTRLTFLAYGIGLLPFFVFDYYFYFVTPILTLIGSGGDFIGNLIMMGVCWLGWRQTPDTVRQIA